MVQAVTSKLQLRKPFDSGLKHIKMKEYRLKRQTPQETFKATNDRKKKDAMETK